MNIEQIKIESAGKWPGIFEKLGIQVGTGKHCPCPVCGGTDRFRFDDKDGNGTFICGQCGAGDGFTLIQKVLSVDFPTSIQTVADLVGTVEPSKYQKEKEASPEVLRKLFKSSSRISNNDLSHIYLKKRGLKTLPSEIWTSKKCWEPETKKEQIAMLAVFRLPDDTAVTAHRTYLDNQGNKLKIDSPKKILPPLKPMAGGAVRLFEPADGQIAITEGIETAIAVYEMIKIPTWAALTSTLLSAWEPPKGITSVLIYGDNDSNYTGQKAAYALANKLAVQYKIKTDVDIPAISGTDWLDEINRLKQ